MENKQQEDNLQDLFGPEARKKIKELADKKSCFFCTNMQFNKEFSTRPMSVQQVDADGNLWFLSAADSNKNKEITLNNNIQLLFQGSSYSDFLNIYGKAFISKDKEKLKELWEPLLKVWFTQGIDDPRITIIKVEPENGYYWDTKNNMAIGFVKRVVGAIIGKTMDDSIEGAVRV